MENAIQIRALSALAQPTRLQAFHLLVHHEPDGLPAGELARLMDVQQNTMSAHLAVLSRAELVAATREGRQVIYRANIDSIRGLARFLLNDCCGASQSGCDDGSTVGTDLATAERC